MLSETSHRIFDISTRGEIRKKIVENMSYFDLSRRSTVMINVVGSIGF